MLIYHQKCLPSDDDDDDDDDDDITLKNLSGSAIIEYQIVRTAAYESVRTTLGHRRGENGMVAKKKASNGEIHEVAW